MVTLSNRDFIEGLKSSRRYFLRHLGGLTPEQIAWKPYPECKNVVETLAHLAVDDMAALEGFQTHSDPDYEAIQPPEGNYPELLAILAESHRALIEWLDKNLGDAPITQEASAFGNFLPAARAIAYISSEDYYHAGQVAFIRMATDSSWDYYSAIYSADD